jgi:hypothetical protein
MLLLTFLPMTRVNNGVMRVMPMRRISGPHLPRIVVLSQGVGVGVRSGTANQQGHSVDICTIVLSFS